MAEILPILDKRFYTVSELTEEIKYLIEDEFFDIWIVGEVSNIATPMSGHTYFTLKDKKASIRAVLFKGQKSLINYNFKNGEEVLVRGRLSLYEPRGEYQIIVDYLEPYGIGKLYLKIEQLKKKLAKEGLFDKKYKKEIPKFPEKIGVITSITGAAIHDILNVLKRRFAGIELFIYPVKVQGDDAPGFIVDAFKFFENFREKIDVIIIARGGGSLEDLMPFNSEDVARAIFQSSIPVISAVGHETDYSIADFVADLRAPTPSAAAEIVVKNKHEVILHLDNLTKRLTLLMNSTLSKYKSKISNISQKLTNFNWKLYNLKSKVYNLEKDLIVFYKNYLKERENRIKNLHLKLLQHTPEMRIKNFKDKLDYLSKNLYKRYFALHKIKKDKFTNLMQSLHYLSPLNILNRGYALVQKDGKLVSSVKHINTQDNINIKLSDGEILATVNSINNKVES